MYHYNVSTFRAERICHLEMVDEKAVEKPKGFSLDRYSRQIFGIIANDIDMYIEARWTRDTFRVFIIVYECQLESEPCARLILSHLCSFESEPPKPRSSNAPDGRSLHSYQEYMI